MAAEESARHGSGDGTLYQPKLFELDEVNSTPIDELPPETRRWVFETLIWLHENLDAAVRIARSVLDTSRAGGRTSVAALCGELANDSDNPIAVNHNIIPVFARLIIECWPMAGESVELRSSRFDGVRLTDDDEWLERAAEYYNERWGVADE